MAVTDTISSGQVSHPVTIVIFGASGDLTHRKLIPALYMAFAQGLLPQTFAIVGFARRDYSGSVYRDMMADAIRSFARIPADEASVERFIEHIHYHRGDISDYAAYEALREVLKNDETYPANRLYYLSIIPSLFETAVEYLRQSGLIAGGMLES